MIGLVLGVRRDRPGRLSAGAGGPGEISPMAALRDAGTPADARAGRIRGRCRYGADRGGRVRPVAAAAAARRPRTGRCGWPRRGADADRLRAHRSAARRRCGPGARRRCVLRVFGPVGRLAERNALRNPRRTGATGAALMIGLALVACLSVVGSSMVASANASWTSSVGADFIIQSSWAADHPAGGAAYRTRSAPGARDRVQAAGREHDHAGREQGAGADDHGGVAKLRAGPAGEDDARASWRTPTGPTACPCSRRFADRHHLKVR